MATLIRPASNGGKELILKITPKRGKCFTRPELFSFVGVDFVLMQLMSDDYILVEKDHADPAKGRNDLATRLTRGAVIHGTAFLCEPWEID